MRRQKITVVNDLATTQQLVLGPWGETYPIAPGCRLAVGYSSVASGSRLGRVRRLFRATPPLDIEVQDGFIKLHADGDGILELAE